MGTYSTPITMLVSGHSVKCYITFTDMGTCGKNYGTYIAFKFLKILKSWLGTLKQI